MQNKQSDSLQFLKLPGIVKAPLRLYIYFRSVIWRRREMKRVIIIEGVLQDLVDVYSKAKKEKDDELIKIYNKCTYLLTIEYDVAIMKVMMLMQQETWGQQVVGRQFVILLYESINDLPRIIGKDLTTLVASLPDKKEICADRDVIAKQFGAYKQHYEERLKVLRNYCSAHRDLDAQEQLRQIRSISIKEIATMAKHFMDIAVQLYELYQRIMNSMTDSRSEITLIEKR